MIEVTISRCDTENRNEPTYQFVFTCPFCRGTVKWWIHRDNMYLSWDVRCSQFGPRQRTGGNCNKTVFKFIPRTE